jgi:hypothetical protein
MFSKRGNFMLKNVGKTILSSLPLLLSLAFFIKKLF